MKRLLTVFASMLLMLSLNAAPNPQGQGKKDQKQSDKKDDKGKGQNSDNSKDSGGNNPLFSGTIDAKSNQKSGDTATLGFKGVGPDGQIDPAKLAENPTAADENLVMQIQQISVANSDLKDFIQDGHLKGR